MQWLKDSAFVSCYAGVDTLQTPPLLREPKRDDDANKRARVGGSGAASKAGGRGGGAEEDGRGAAEHGRAALGRDREAELAREEDCQGPGTETIREVVCTPAK